MEKERAIRCVPSEMLERLKALAETLWNEKNPASVHLNAVLEEFDPDVRTLDHIVKEYETDYSGRLAFNAREHSQKESALREELAGARARSAELEKKRAEDLKKMEELKAALAAKDAALGEVKAKAAEDESALNARYVAKMQELYEKVNRKEMEMLARWEERNKGLEVRVQSLESDFAAKARQSALREKALEEDFNGRKAELIRTFDRIRADLEAREKTLVERERRKPGKPQSYSGDL